ncbi:hypothetical protein [Actinoplanes sp. NPDC049118]|uniref:hypothetical protein n=1 Tax=Actinoplanes sp. NPDC049118 TaxID=3155769 RepID=UPI0033DF11E7
MARFGIQDYEPHWLNGRDSITAVHGRRLARLAGRILRHVWLVWDLDDDEWFADAPVLLDFGDDRVGIDHQKFDDLCITWNTVDPARAIEDPADEDCRFNLAWRPEPTRQLAELAGRTLQRVELLEWAGGYDDMANGSVAIGLDLAPAWLTIFNALDENGLAFGPPESSYRRHYLNGP